MECTESDDAGVASRVLASKGKQAAKLGRIGLSKGRSGQLGAPDPPIFGATFASPPGAQVPQTRAQTGQRCSLQSALSFSRSRL
jgi:hypothetical protein